MKRSSQIGLAAAGVLLVATVWSMTGEETQESLVYNNLSECQADGQIGYQQCEAAFSEAAAARLKDAPKFRSQSDCEAQYGASGCNTASIGGAQYFIPALAGFMLARGMAGNQAQPLLPPTTAACPPGAAQPECQQARSSSSSSSSSGGGSGGSSRSRAYSTTTGRGFTAAAVGARGVVSTTSVSSRGGFGSFARSFSSHSSS
ncbi:DUF1190 domain-containing protein [Bosea sp. NBC_00550]|uniref:DUF1190 domain-containing protein n=1 Tax=Bosea sp. NBC_00550 TaxID=2969621 RepID=UPI0022312C9F|nr:DUF1190 domain-containing protein [Bosea sp. NBC_00550]UZF93696.1 DUF1190 domain-containing protein [Bosea sp. NBC_00550]